jgi:hypothetical protein
MTVAELISKLQQMPQHAVLVRKGDERRLDERYVQQVEYRDQLMLGILCAPSVMIQ